MKCPLRKITFKSTDCKGADFSTERWYQTEDFDDCIGKECAAYETCFQVIESHSVHQWRCALCKGDWHRVN